MNKKYVNMICEDILKICQRAYFTLIARKVKEALRK